jgi:hypothetical protein
MSSMMSRVYARAQLQAERMGRSLPFGSLLRARLAN